MARVYTEETLQPLIKTQLIKLFLKTQGQTSNTIKTGPSDRDKALY